MAKSREQKRLERKQLKSKTRAQQYAESARRKAQKGTKKQVVRRSPKTNGYKHDTADRRQAIKHTEAVQRQAEHKSLSVAEKINKVQSRRGNSARELARLTILNAK